MLVAPTASLPEPACSRRHRLFVAVAACMTPLKAIVSVDASGSERPGQRRTFRTAHPAPDPCVRLRRPRASETHERTHAPSVFVFYREAIVVSSLEANWRVSLRPVLLRHLPPAASFPTKRFGVAVLEDVFSGRAFAVEHA